MFRLNVWRLDQNCCCLPDCMFMFLVHSNSSCVSCPWSEHCNVFYTDRNVSLRWTDPSIELSEKFWRQALIYIERGRRPSFRTCDDFRLRRKLGVCQLNIVEWTLFATLCLHRGFQLYDSPSLPDGVPSAERSESFLVRREAPPSELPFRLGLPGGLSPNRFKDYVGEVHRLFRSRQFLRFSRHRRPRPSKN